MHADEDKLVQAIYACATSDDAIPTWLELLAAHFACPSAALVYQDLKHQIADLTVSYGLLDGEALDLYRAEFAQYDPAPAAMAHLALGQATSTGRLFDSREAEHKYFLESFYYPLGLREALGGPITRHEDRYGVVAVQRGPDRPAFDDEDIRVFEKVMPHIVQAMAIRRSFFALERRTEELRTVMEPLPMAVLTLGADGRIQHANLEARSILDRRDGLVVERSSRLSTLNHTLSARLAELARTGSSLPEVIRVPRRDDRRPYIMRVSSSLPGSAAHSGASVVLRIHDPDRAFPDAERLIGVAFAMSASVARLTAALMSGESLAAYAERERIPINTVKFQLKAAFNATGTNRQTELVRRAFAVVRDLGL